MKNRQLTKVFRAAAAVLLAGALCGCSVKFGTNKEPKPGAIVAHATSGEDYEDMKITYEEFRKEYLYVLLNAGIEDDKNLDEDLDAQCKEARERTIQNLINKQVMLLKAKELGVYELTADEQAEVDKQYDEKIASQIKILGQEAAAALAASETSGEDPEESAPESSAESAPTVSDEEIESLGKEKLDKILSDSGMTYDDLKWLVQRKKINDKLYDEIVKDISKSDIDKGYEELIEEAKAMFKDYNYYFFQMGYSDVWLPEGSRYIKHVLLGFDDEKMTEIRTLRTDGKDEEADKLREEEAAKLEEKRLEVEQKLDDGANIDDLITEYSADKEGSEAYPDGYLVVPDDTRWKSEFTKGAFVPEQIGERTIVVTDYGVHIMVYVGDAKISDSKVEQVRNSVILNQLQQEKYTATMNKWLEEYAYEIDYDALRIDAPNAEESSES